MSKLRRLLELVKECARLQDTYEFTKNAAELLDLIVAEIEDLKLTPKK